MRYLTTAARGSGIGAIAWAPASNAPALAGEFDGAIFRGMTFTGAQIAEPLLRYAPEFDKMTVAFSDLCVAG